MGIMLLMANTMIAHLPVFIQKNVKGDQYIIVWYFFLLFYLHSFPTSLYFGSAMQSRTKYITSILTCESHLFQPWNFHMWSRENFNMQIRLKLCQIWRVEKFHTWKFHT